jgi:hypothetical protein
MPVRPEAVILKKSIDAPAPLCVVLPVEVPSKLWFGVRVTGLAEAMVSFGSTSLLPRFWASVGRGERATAALASLASETCVFIASTSAQEVPRA